MKSLYLLIPMAPLAGSIIAGMFGKWIGRKPAAILTIVGVLISFLASCVVFKDVLNGNTFNGQVYSWAQLAGLNLEVGFQIDTLTTMMMLVVTFVSLMVHIYTMGYMADDPGYQRFSHIFHYLHFRC